MFRTTLLLLIFFTKFYSSAQETINRTVHYAYDANGNRIQRWVTVEEAQVPDTTGLLKNLTFVKTGQAGATEPETGKMHIYTPTLTNTADGRIQPL
jgi:hypothetical protein